MAVLYRQSILTPEKWVGDAKQILLQAVIDGRHLCFRPMFFNLINWPPRGAPLSIQRAWGYFGGVILPIEGDLKGMNALL